MTRDDILSMARKAGLQKTHPGMAPEVLAFAAMVAAAEREACANVCEKKPTARFTMDGKSIREIVGERLAAEIRARGAV